MEKARIWEETIMIPTYGVGKEEKNPIFLEKRVYQGSSGKVYPYPVIEKIEDKKEKRPYQAVYLENEYLLVMVLPELGGRIQRAYDKTNGYDFVYYNHVIKPALVGLAGPWISGGIEFNWPQHHRPTTYMPTDFKMEQKEDGSVSVLLHDVDRMYGTSVITTISLHPGTAYIDIEGKLYNGTSFPQTFLWWANPAVAVNEDTQSVFPPDVHAVMDHGKRDVSKFPIADGVYYKHNYAPGCDISRYSNIPVPTSYMAAKSDFDFVGGYDYAKKAGLLHVADHHISPGKKQWTWGCGDFGKAWDRNLTDEDGPYIELMTGMFTDNQPDFSWLKPFEEKTFHQYFMPYKNIGYVKNATKEAAINISCEPQSVVVKVYVTKKQEQAVISLYRNGELCFQERATISPSDAYERVIPLSYDKPQELKAEVCSQDKDLLVSYTPVEEWDGSMPEAAKAAKAPEEIETCEELYLTGFHLEQYRHATYEPEDYYKEGLRRDKRDVRLNQAYGMLLLKRGRMSEAEAYFRTAIERMTMYNPNPYDSEAYIDLGLCLFYQERYKEAEDAFYKASWSAAQKEMAFYYLAVIQAGQKKYEKAYEFIDKCIRRNAGNQKAIALKAVLLRKLKRKEEAAEWIQQGKKEDPFSLVLMMEEELLNHTRENEKLDKERFEKENRKDTDFLQAAKDYAIAGFYEEALDMISLCKKESPMPVYYKAYYCGKLSKEEEVLRLLKKAESLDPRCCFPNELSDIAVLSEAIRKNPNGAKAYYYLGNLYYDKKQYRVAKELWEKSASIDDAYPTVLRNLAIEYFNKEGKKEEALALMEKAFSLDTKDARILLELDQLRRKMDVECEKRLLYLEQNLNTVLMRDDLCLQYAALLNDTGRSREAFSIIKKRKFHPWEGGEGKVPKEYVRALTNLAKEKMSEEKWEEALSLLKEALIYPENLGEGRLEGQKDNEIYYHIGVIYEKMGRFEKAQEAYQKATLGEDRPQSEMYYNDQPADQIYYQGMAFIKLKKEDEAAKRFNALETYGKEHQMDHVKIDYFAVSLPDLSVFDEDLDKRNHMYCEKLIALGQEGKRMITRS
ncbi:MAG: DUF5107 domain-containing protein [Lachnospiraceae bacterium]|nr:DUF5107 domain-containing protein [Lachnospiraceae bacterium]